jgi:hypothetical protein
MEPLAEVKLTLIEDRGHQADMWQVFKILKSKDRV